MNLESLHKISLARLEVLFNQYLNESTSNSRQLQEAMVYSVTNGGKRIRPLLVYATGVSLGGTLEQLDASACAIEFIHAYSLIHDDLPAMDNSDLRRGKPSCHKAFDEATAILAGDALQPLAFQVLAEHASHSLKTEQRLAMIQILSRASGMSGMVAGQALDLAGTEQIEAMYHLKTGALMVACVKLGLIATSTHSIAIEKALETYAKNISLAFQIQDDLLDFEGSQTTGKPQGIDLKNQKITYPVLAGVENTRLKIDELFSKAIDQLCILGDQAALLKEFALYLMRRKG